VELWRKHKMDHECSGCGACGPEDDTIIISLEDGSELECNILGIFDVEETSYIALLPIDDDEVIFYTYEEEEQSVAFGYIESSEEYDMVFDAFAEIFEYDEDDFDDDIYDLYGDDDDFDDDDDYDYGDDDYDD